MRNARHRHNRHILFMRDQRAADHVQRIARPQLPPVVHAEERFVFFAAVRPVGGQRRHVGQKFVDPKQRREVLSIPFVVVCLTLAIRN